MTGLPPASKRHPKEEFQGKLWDDQVQSHSESMSRWVKIEQKQGNVTRH